ncbi:beta-lactamase class A [Crossiella equi]|uniref:Beta-lactamase class A n=1 Tax=Crossiella equi TaxID=130796 RepID=A0ABS5A6U9_9PSEU|nr:class A beta-lactamase [Crossiella equi]MBP2472320.1 beta-lactamase class A [Crossiella equi]
MIVAIRAAALVLGLGLLAGCTTSTAVPQPPVAASAVQTVRADEAFLALERKFGARLGVSVVDTGSGRTLAYRADERFAHASTFKALAAGVVLRRASDADLDRVIQYTEKDLLEYAPITKQRVGTGMSLRELLDASVRYSDNTAANLIFTYLGGPQALQRELRALGDVTIQVDRVEPALNEATPGDPRDTTTPAALATTLRALALGDALTPPRRQVLVELLQGNTTGGPYVRAGVPAGWRVGDKTGSGGYGTRNDVAVVWPDGGRAPLVLALLSDRGKPGAESGDALLAEATRAALTALDQR